MSKLEELIKEFCPNGVEYVKIGSVVNYEQPSKYLVKKADYKEEYSTPVLTAGQTFILGYTNEMNGIYNASKDSPVIIFDDFTGAFKWVDFLFKVKSSAIKFLKANEKRAMLRYVFHVMGNINLTSTEHKRLWIGIYSELQIPLPALPVQREIVRILDSFTLYSAELTAELTARRKQYEFYRDKLLNFNQQEVEIKKLSDIFDTRNGYTPSTSNKEYWATNDIPWFRVEDIRANGRILNDSIQHVSYSAIKGKVFPANSIIISTSATIGEHALITCESIANQRFTYLMLKDQYKDKYNIKYLFYYCFLLADFCRENLQQGSFASVDMNKFNKFEFPIPPMKVQEKIVKVLDNFDAICSDLGIGLPAEIEKRQKQYEYYREKLLTFDGKYATILTERNGTERNGTERNGTGRAD